MPKAARFALGEISIGLFSKPYGITPGVDLIVDGKLLILLRIKAITGHGKPIQRTLSLMISNNERFFIYIVPPDPKKYKLYAYRLTASSRYWVYCEMSDGLLLTPISLSHSSLT